MTTVEVPTTIRPGALELAKKLGVERELEAILEQGRRTVCGLRALEVEDGSCDGDEAVTIRAWVDPSTQNDPSHADWWNWRIDEYGPEVAASFVVVVDAERSGDAR